MTVIEERNVEIDTKRNKNHVANAQGHKIKKKRRKRTLGQT